MPVAPEEHHSFLQKYFRYYRLLPESEQSEFLRRVEQFRRFRDFHGRKGLKVDVTTEVFVSAFAIQLTFGLEQFMLPHFKTIVIYPDSFMVGHRVNRHIPRKGEVHQAGAVALSLKHLIEGEKAPYDGYNLGIHEFAHAMFIENTVWNREFHFFKPAQINRWRSRAHKALLEMRKGVPSLLRSYASSNSMEFFAVAAESFFERPVAFKDQLPELYDMKTELLQQDPASRLSDS